MAYEIIPPATSVAYVQDRRVGLVFVVEGNEIERQEAAGRIVGSVALRLGAEIASVHVASCDDIPSPIDFQPAGQVIPLDEFRSEENTR